MPLAFVAFSLDDHVILYINSDNNDTAHAVADVHLVDIVVIIFYSILLLLVFILHFTAVLLVHSASTNKP